LSFSTCASRPVALCAPEPRADLLLASELAAPRKPLLLKSWMKVDVVKCPLGSMTGDDGDA
jgi:hypothetical protein